MTATGQYLDLVLAELADLPAAEVDEIAADLGPQLDELGARASIETLVSRLGTPAHYAEELRAAAGYPPGRKSRLLPGLAWLSLVAGVVVAILMGMDSGLNSVRDTLHWQNTEGILLLAPFALLPAIAVGLEARGRFMSLPGRLIRVVPTAARAYLTTLRPAWVAARIVILCAATLLALWYPLASYRQVLLPMIVLAALLLFGSRFATRRLWTVTVLCNAFVVGLIAAFVLAFLAGAGGSALPDYPY